MQTLKLSNTLAIPMLGFGTWELRGKACEKAVRLALEVGYRHFDTALLYDNHEALHLATQGYAREELFFTSKFMPYHLKKQSVTQTCEQALKELHVDYLDLYLMHYPDRDLSMPQIIEELGSLLDSGKVRGVGVSNFTIKHLEDVLPTGVPLCANQVEYHPYLNQKALLAFCQQHQIHLISFRPLGKGALVEDPLLIEIAKKYGRTPAQIAIRWIMQKGLPVIPKASSKQHIEENFAIDFELNEEDFARLDHLDQQHRYCDNELGDFNYE